MPGASHSWFAADEFFQRKDGWYVGSRNGLRIGPYPNRQTAQVQSAEAQRELARAKTGSDRVRIVSRLIAAQKAADAGHVQVRQGESPHTRFRTERCFSTEGRWYFSTREGLDVGPYDTKSAAETDARRLVRLLRKCTTDEQCILAIYEFVRRPIGGSRLA